MDSSNKNSNFKSPYAQHTGQYPSQATEYVSQHAGGQQTTGNTVQHDKRKQNSNQDIPHFYQNRTPQKQNFGFYEDRHSSSPSTPHFYKNNGPHQERGRGRGHRGGQRGRPWQPKHQRHVSSNIQYFHRSMLEDPWRELMERQNAIHGSVLSKDHSTTKADT